MDKFYMCDLHVHSSSCYSRNYSREGFIKRIKESEMEVLSITDHNIIDKSIYIDLMNQTDKLYILGIEMNIHLSEDTIKRHKLQKSELDYFHSILWFNIKDIDEIVDVLFELQKSLIAPETIEYPVDYKELSRKLEGKSFSLESIQKSFTKHAYFFVPHEGKSDRNLSYYLPNSNDENQYYKQKLFYYNNNYGIEGKKNDKILDFFDKKLNTLIADFYFSDAQKLSEIGTNFTWINFGGDFNSLILPFSDPETRVFKSIDFKRHPQKNKNNYLQFVKFNIGENNYELEFNPGINGIIGARGSGKSLLANVITNQISNYSSMKIGKIQYKMKDSEYSSVVPDNQYINQGYLSKLFDERDFRKIDYIDKIKKDLVERKKGSIDSNINIVKTIFEELKDSIDDFIKNKLNKYCFEEIKQCKEDASLIPSIGDLEKKNDEVLRIATLSKIMDYKKTLESAKLQIENVDYEFTFLEASEVKEKVKKAKNLSVDYIEKNIETCNNLILDLSDKKLIKLIDFRNKNLKQYRNLLNQINGDINNEVKVSMDKYGNFIEYLKALNQLRYKLIDKINKANIAYDNIFKQIEKRSFKLSDGTEINITTNLDQHESFKALIGNYFKNDDLTFDSLITNILLEDFGLYYHKNKIRNVENVNVLFEKFFEKIVLDVKQHEKIDIDIYVDNKNIQELSPGKQSEILLRIIVEKEINDDENLKFIVLDQPEDNLDTQTIVTFLVDKLRELKLEQQIFVVSHSAPLIVNSDSDLVISCKNTDKITYDTGNINDIKIRNSIVDVLDGGEKYLKMRVNKYDFNYKEIK